MTSNRALSVPDRVYVGAADESESVTVRSTAFWTFSAIVTEAEDVNVGATSSTSVMVTVTACVAAFPPASVAVTVSAHGFDAHVMDS